MNKIELKQLETQLNDLNAFVIGKKIEHTEDEIIEWVSKCISVFSGLGINEVIVSKFIEYFSPDILNESIINGRKKMGNFEGRLYFSDKYSKVNESYLIDIAFLTAKSILGRLSEEERLVPSWMLRELANNKEYSNIYSSLELIEKNYTDKDSDGIIKNSLSLLENVLDLDDDLKKEGNLGNKIKRLVGDKEKASKFGLTDEFIGALNNARILRNNKSIHKILPIKYDIPFLIAISNAYLVIMALEMFLSCKE